MILEEADRAIEETSKEAVTEAVIPLLVYKETAEYKLTALEGELEKLQRKGFVNVGLGICLGALGFLVIDFLKGD